MTPNSWQAYIEAPQGKRFPNGDTVHKSHPFELKEHAEQWLHGQIEDLCKYYFAPSAWGVTAVYHRNPIKASEVAV